MSFVWIDWLILAVIGFGLWRGFTAGFIHQAAHLIGLLLGFVLGVQLMYPAGHVLTNVLDLSDQLAPLLGFVLVFVGVLLAVILLAQLIERLVGAVNLSTVNRLLGGAMGALEAVLLLSLFLWITDPFNWPGQEARTQSLLIEPIEVVAEAAWEYSAEIWPEINRLSREISGRFQSGVGAVATIAGDSSA